MNRLAIVTGTSRGLGLAIAQALLERGWRVQGIARSEAPAELENERYEHERLDLADLPEMERFFEGPFAEKHAPEDVDRLALVNNAGLLAPVAPIAELGAAEVGENLIVNAAAPLWLAGFVVRRGPRAPIRIVNVSSGAATSAYSGWGPYCVGKAALRMASAVLAREVEEVESLSGRDVAVVDYAPNVVDTHMQAQLRSTPEERFPMRARFIQLFESGSLVAAEGPAGEIADWVEAEGVATHSEARFEPR